MRSTIRLPDALLLLAVILAASGVLCFPLPTRLLRSSRHRDRLGLGLVRDPIDRQELIRETAPGTTVRSSMSEDPIPANFHVGVGDELD
jgi:hypothetical protein